MKRDMDVVREIIIAIAAADGPSSLKSLLEGKQDSDIPSITFHLDLLYEAAFIKGIRTPMKDVTLWNELTLTWSGHDFYDSVQDDEIWEQTKAGAKVAGGFTVDLLADLAKGLIKTQIKKYTGVEVGE